MSLSMHLRSALANLTASKLRSLLSILGILVGTASVVALISIGQLATEKALQEFKSLGTDLFAVSFFPEKPASQRTQMDTMDLPTALAIQKAVPAIVDLAPYTLAFLPISYNGQTIANSGIVGATPSLQAVIKIDIAAGRFISWLDQSAYYTVIGQELFKHLQAAGMVNPLGQQIHVGHYFFTIVGVAATWHENSFFNNDINNALIIPIAASKLLGKDVMINNFVLRLAPKADINQVQESVTRYIRAYTRDQRLYFRSAQEIIKSMSNQQQIFTLLLGMIGGISLLVGGIGVMNIMLVSVVERRREIGIRMAVGARRRDIQSLFLLESVTLSLIGGIMGVALGILVSLLVALFAEWDFKIFILPPVIGFIVSVAIGIFFGFYPAYTASRLDPIQTLRSE